MAQTIARWLHRRVEFSYQGRIWPLVFSHRALLICEEVTGVDMLLATLASPSASLIRALLFAALQCGGAACSLESVGKGIARKNFARVRESVYQAWTASMADVQPDKPEGEARDLSWLETWAIGRYDLKLSDEEWLDMTPRQFRALQDVRLQTLQREELLIGIVAAEIENFSAHPPRRPATPESFMLHKLPPDRRQKAVNLDRFTQVSWSANEGLSVV